MTETTWEYTLRDVSPLISYSGNGYNSSQGGLSHLNTGWTQPGPGCCNPPSSHQTNVSGASISLTFYGQSVRLFGNVSGGMQYVVTLDNVSRVGTPSGQLLVSESMLTPGYHTIGVTASPMSDGGILTFQGASITVGTGLTGALVTRTIIQDTNPSVQYSGEGWKTPAFDTYAIQHTISNETWHDTYGLGSYYSFQFSANTIMVYGFSWTSTSSTHRFSLDNDPPTTLYANSSLTVINTYAASGLAFFRTNLSGSSHYLRVTNGDAGGLGLDYIKFVNITGGTPLLVGPRNSTSSPALGHPISPGAIAGAVIGGLIVLMICCFGIWRWRKARSNETSGRGVGDEVNIRRVVKSYEVTPR